MTTAVIIVAGVVLVAALLVGIFIAATWAPERTVADLQPRWAGPPSVFVDVAGSKVHLRDEGPREDESPLVLVHGTSSSLHAWEGWAAALKEKRRVVRFDLLGFGLTGPSPDGIYTIDNDVRFVIAVLDTLGVKRCVLAGASLGGAVAWRTALAYPMRVDKLILVDAGGYPAHSTSVPIGFRLARVPGIAWLFQNTLPRSLVVQGLRNVFGDPNKVTREMVDHSVEINQRAGNRRALIARFRQRRADTASHRIAELKLPTLIIWGGRDRLVPLDDAVRFHRDIAGSTLVIFDELGHAPEEEDPAATVAAVRRFLGLD
jgi:pimeloyl-ACP methyl ester carboxylesterase